MATFPNPDPRETTVLVTGASGFIGLHCVRHLLEVGYRVRGTLRTPSREARLRDALVGHVDAGDQLEFSAADLTRDEGWAEAVRGCTHVLHVASPFPLTIPKHEDELIVPARDGTLRVLRVAAEAGVERVVLTSSLAAVLAGLRYGKPVAGAGVANQGGGASSVPRPGGGVPGPASARAACPIITIEPLEGFRIIRQELYSQTTSGGLLRP